VINRKKAIFFKQKKNSNANVLIEFYQQSTKLSFARRRVKSSSDPVLKQSYSTKTCSSTCSTRSSKSSSVDVRCLLFIVHHAQLNMTAWCKDYLMSFSWLSTTPWPHHGVWWTLSIRAISCIVVIWLHAVCNCERRPTGVIHV